MNEGQLAATLSGEGNSSTRETSSLIRQNIPTQETEWDYDQEFDITIFSRNPPDSTSFLPSFSGIWSKGLELASYAYRPLTWAGTFHSEDHSPQMAAMGCMPSSRKQLKRRGEDDIIGGHRRLSEEARRISEEHLEDFRRCEQLQAEVDKLVVRNIELEKRNSNLSQGQDFMSEARIAGPEHGKVQDQLATLGRGITNWVRSTFSGISRRRNPLITVENFPFNDFPEFQKELFYIWNQDVDATTLMRMRVSLDDLLEAVVTYIIFKHIILKPLNSCVPDFQEQVETGVYSFMELVNSKEARRWQASCLSAYEGNKNGTLYTPEMREQAQIEYCMKVSKSILHAVENVARVYCGKEPAEESLIQILKQASDLAMLLGKLHSRLELMDLQWFEKEQLEFSSFDNRMALRSASNNENLKANSKGTLAVLLCPGLLKWGRDNGDNFENWSIWTPAKVEATNLRLTDEFPVKSIPSPPLAPQKSTDTSFGGNPGRSPIQAAPTPTFEQSSAQKNLGYKSHPRMISHTSYQN